MLTRITTGVQVASKGTLGLWVLKLLSMYATDGQTDGRTKATLIAPSVQGRGHNKPERNCSVNGFAVEQVDTILILGIIDYRIGFKQE